MEDKQNILFIGDSLTEFFDWQTRFPAYKIFNLGIAGETVEGLLARVDRILFLIRNEGWNPELIFIMTGINNIAMEDYDIIGSYKQVAGAITNAFSDSKFIIQSILPTRLPWVDNTVIREINEKLKDIAKEFRAEYLDLYGLFMGPDSTPVKDHLLDDGVHLSDKGYAVWSGAIEERFFLSV